MVNAVANTLYYPLPSDTKAIALGCYFDEAAANKYIRFFEKHLKHSKGRFAGKPFKLLLWEKRFIATVYGWKTAEGLRRFNRVWLEIPKKNGKSTLAAGIALAMLTIDGEASAEIYLAANDREQAGIVYREGSAMVQGSELSRYCVVADSRKTITFPQTQSILKALSAEGFRHEGINAHCVIWDELHSYKSRDMWDSLAYSGAARSQPLQIVITTAGVYEPEGLGWTEHEYAVKVAAGDKEDIHYFPLIFAASNDDDIDAEATWYKANPSLGETITLESFRADYERAKARPRDLNQWKRYRLNIWTEQAECWIENDVFAACSGGVTVDQLKQDNKDKACIVGLDLGARNDLSAASLLFPTRTGYDLLTECWLPKAGLPAREERDEVSYSSWERQGYLHLTPDDMTDYASIAKRLIELNNTYEVKAIVSDRAYLKFLLPIFEANNVSKAILDKFIEYPQNLLNLSAPTKRWEELIRGKAIRHGGNPILIWQNNNVALKENNDLIMVHKSKSTKRIDCIAAGIMALGYAMQNNLTMQPKKCNYIVWSD